LKVLANLDLNERRIVVLFFTGVASFSAVAAAIVPAFI
jgi:hypothetical protein